MDADTFDENDDITGLEFKEPVKLKSRWQVKLSTRRCYRGVDEKILYETDDYDDCHDCFALEKERLVKELIMTEAAYRLKVSSSFTPAAYTCAKFSVIDEIEDVSYYLRLTKI